MSASDVLADFFTKQETRIRVEHSDSAPLCYIAFGGRYRKLPFDVDASRLRDALTEFINTVEDEQPVKVSYLGEGHVVEPGGR